MTAVAARTRCAALEVVPWDDAALAAAITTVTAALLAASPRVTPAAGEPGLWWVGAAGLDRLGGERALARAALAIARRWHPRARVGIADSCIAARTASWAAAGGAGAVHVPPGGDARYLARAPLAFIPMDDELRDTLAALGIHTAGALAALDAEAIERRWGPEGLAAWQLARGIDRRRPVHAQPAPPRTVDAELPVPSPDLAPVLFLVRAALDTLGAALAGDGRAAAAIALTLTLTLDDVRRALPTPAPAHTITREVRLPRPTARAAHLFDHCRALLERWPLTAPVGAVRVAIVATAPLGGEQGDLLAPAWRDPAAIDAALARLRAELGPDGVVQPAARDGHAPERAGAWVPNAQPAGDAAATSGGDGPAHAAALRLLETPEPVDVACERGTPRAVWWRGRHLAIDRAVGPELLAGDWWRDDGYRRAYWQCAGTGTELVLVRERRHWYVQGWYD